MDGADLGAGEGEAGVLSSQGFSLVDVATQELNFGGVRVPPYVIAQRANIPVKIDLTWLQFEAVRTLCVQPVRIGRITITGGWPLPIFDIEFAGAGSASRSRAREANRRGELDPTLRGS